MLHELKTLPISFEAVVNGEKTFEFRKNDRGFCVGDKLLLREWDEFLNAYTNRCALVNVTYVFLGTTFPSFPVGYVIMSISAPLGLSGVRNQDNLDQF